MKKSFDTFELKSNNEFEIGANSYMRGEPIEAMGFSLIYGLKPESWRLKNNYNSKRRNDGNVHKSHIPSRISLGRGGLKSNAASMPEFGGLGNVIYPIDQDVEKLQSFKPNSLHSSNAEYLAKGVPYSFIKAIITHDEDRDLVIDQIKTVKSLIENNAFPMHREESIEQEREKRISFLNSLPIISFEEEIKKEK